MTKIVLQVTKEDIAVRFFEESNGQIVWEGYGDFQHSNVHKQVAISFRTPPYRSMEIDQPVKVIETQFERLKLTKSNRMKIVSISVLHSTAENIGQNDK